MMEPMSDAAALRPEISAQDGFLTRNGKPYRMLAGSMHYFRVHPAQWEDRLRRLAAMGANTVDTYVAWNFHERVEGDIRFDGWQDIERFIGLAGEIGLDVLLRPSPYICAEWSNGGLPHWLTARVSALRTSDPDYLAAIDRWYDVLLPRVVPLQAAYGGPIIAVQIENEYGSFGADHAYLEHLRDALLSRGIVEMLTTADGITEDMIRHGSVAGALPTFTFGTGVDEALRLRRPDDALICSELWGGWFDHWGEKHHVRSAESMAGTVSALLDAGGSVSMYMAHGGTNFGLWNGANHDRVLQPTVTSYDSDAPIGEDGSLGTKFDALRRLFAPFHEHDLPEPPLPAPLQAAQTAPLLPVASLLDVVDRIPVQGDITPMPQRFEDIGAEDGIVIYQAEVDVPAGSTVNIEVLHDRATVFFDAERMGTMERDGLRELPLPAEGKRGTLTIVVESLGRINYGPLTGEGKGIMRGVRINNRRYVHGWSHRILPLMVPDATVATGEPAKPATTVVETLRDGIAIARIRIAEAADAWLAFPKGQKGMVWLNGFLLGRYWAVGPQETLYAPAPLWRDGVNEVVVLDTDGLGPAVQVREKATYGATEEFIGS